MANVEKTSFAVAKPLTPHTGLAKAWQLLGYQRYLRRDYVRQLSVEQSASSLEAVIPTKAITAKLLSPKALPEVLAQATTARREVAPEAVDAAHLPVEVDTRIADVLQIEQVFVLDHQDFTLLYDERVALCLPALWPQDAQTYTLMAQAREVSFLRHVFNTMKLYDFQGLLTVGEAVFGKPRLQGEVLSLKQWQTAKPRHIVMMGECGHVREILQSVAGQVEYLLCTHPALALQSGKAKQQLWWDLLHIIDTLNEKQMA